MSSNPSSGDILAPIMHPEAALSARVPRWTRRARSIARIGLGLMCLVWSASTASAQAIKMSTRADGIKVITNEGATHRARRLSLVRVPVPTPELETTIGDAARLHDFDPELIQALIQTESGYNHLAVSRVGAMGLMQLMPATAAELGVEDPWDPVANVDGGCRYLRGLVNRFDHLEIALAAYNAGPGAVERHGGIPPYPETEAYVRRVLQLYQGTAPATLRRVPGRKPSWIEGPNERPLLTTETP